LSGALSRIAAFVKISRRQFLNRAALAAAALPALGSRGRAGDGASTGGDIPVIDSHIHLFDPTRPQGVPWPPKENKTLYQPALPSRYRTLANPLGIVGAIEVECSSWLEDNQWVLDIAAKDDMVVGTIGHLVPGTPEFRGQLERFRANPLFRGIRYGLGRQGGQELTRAEFIADLKLLAEADLVLDTANPSLPLLADVVRIGELVPHLRIVIDHLPQMVPPAESAARAAYDASLNALKKQPQIYVKISEVLRRVNGRIPTDLDFYRPRLDEIFAVFGEDRVLFGSDWPNSDQWLPVATGFKLVQDYFAEKSRAAAEKYFWRNSVKCYKWIKRNPAQPSL
jgi:L-fuconolactonase